MDEDYIQLGIIKGAKGLKGHIMASLEKPIYFLETLANLFIEIAHTRVPYVLESYVCRKYSAIIKLQSIDDPITAYQLKGSCFFALQEELPPSVIVQEQLQNLLGYELLDLAQGKLGTVQKIDTFSSPQQLLVVSYLSRELLIPYHEGIIKQVDHIQQSITVQLPSGFLGVFS